MAKELYYGDGVITYGTINGRLVLCFAQDYRFGGALSETHAEKKSVMDMAVKMAHL
jgi:acetyl-CoA carboxylase carboxyltransferase component